MAQGSATSTRPVVVIVAIAAGGPNDAEARLYLPKISELTGQPFIVDFKPGAGTSIGTAYVAKSAPDGHTLLVGTGTFTSMPALYKDLPFDTIKDFAPISLMSRRPTVIVVGASFPARNFAEYLAFARTNPGKINFGTTGSGGTSHLVGAWMHSVTNTQVTFIPYKGTGPMLLEMVAGRVDVTPAVIPAVVTLLKSGKLRAIAVTGDRRSKLLPEIPTVAEQGVPGFNFTNWLGFLAPVATPTPILNRLSEGFMKVARSPEIAAKIEADGGEVVGSTPAELQKVILTETAQWKKVVQDTGIKVDE